MLSHHHLLYVALLVFLLPFSGALASNKSNNTPDKPNFVFIIVDDLKPSLGAYDHPIVKSPNIDQLANEGVTFLNAFANVPVCGASRASLLTGIHPSRERFTRYDSSVSNDVPDGVTLPGLLKQNGYITISLGKVFHDLNDRAEDWSETPWDPNLDSQYASNSWRNYQVPENIVLDKRGGIRGPTYESADVDDLAYYDGITTKRAIDTLKRLKKSQAPFFLALGLRKPHLPFNAPKKYWDLYSADQISLPRHNQLPKNAPTEAYHRFSEIRKYEGVPDKGPLPEDLSLKLIHGYYAAVSYIDAQVGRLTRALNELQLHDNTVLVLLGDHGFSLGEHGLWCKHSPFEEAIQAPLLLKAPQGLRGVRRKDLVGFVDLYPTIAELAGVEVPQAQVDGISIADLLYHQKAKSKPYVYSRWKNAEVIRSDRYRYTEWRDPEEPNKVIARMLYDHKVDPLETDNLAETKRHQKITNQLSDALHRFVAENE